MEPASQWSELYNRWMISCSLTTRNFSPVIHTVGLDEHNLAMFQSILLQHNDLLEFFGTHAWFKIVVAEGFGWPKRLIRCGLHPCNGLLVSQRHTSCIPLFIQGSSICLNLISGENIFAKSWRIITIKSILSLTNGY